MLQEINVSNCKRNPYLNIQEDAENIKRLVKSIKEIGLHCPIGAMEDPEKKGEYIVSDGYHRVQAFIELGFDKISADIEPYNDVRLRVLAQEY